MFKYSERCPLCGEEAMFHFVAFGDRRYFKCGTCGEFQISRTAETRLITAPTFWRTQLSERARAATDDLVLVVLFSYVPPSPGNVTPIIEATLVPRDELPQ